MVHRPGIDKRPKYWPNKFTATLQSKTLSESERDQLRDKVALIPGIKNVNRRNEYLMIEIDNTDQLEELMNEVKKLDGVVQVDRSPIRYAL